MEKVPYHTQQAFIRAILSFRPELTYEKIQEIYLIAYGQEVTWTNIRCAREDLGLTGSPKLNEKLMAFYAYFSKNPDSALKMARGWGESRFREHTRDDIIEQQRERAKKNPMPDFQADAIITNVEQHLTNPQKTLGL